MRINESRKLGARRRPSIRDAMVVAGRLGCEISPFATLCIPLGCLYGAYSALSMHVENVCERPKLYLVIGRYGSRTYERRAMQICHQLLKPNRTSEHTYECRAMKVQQTKPSKRCPPPSSSPVRANIYLKQIKVPSRGAYLRSQYRFENTVVVAN
jgi:hypothetical protein